MEKYLSSATKFLSGIGPDHRGRTLGEILEYDDGDLESQHDFIQWLFPSEEASKFNPDAPVLSRPEFEELRRHPVAVEGVLRAFVRMLSFYGLQLSAPNVVSKGPNWDQRYSNWALGAGHNDLRITRIIKCLVLLSLTEEATALVSFLESEFSSQPARSESLSYWRWALNRAPK